MTGTPSKDRAEAVHAAIEFLGEAANYFEARPTGGEDKAHWANVYNAQNCRKASELLATSFAEGMKRAAEIARTDAELPGEPPATWLALVERIGPIENARSAVRATKKSIVGRILAEIGER